MMIERKVEEKRTTMINSLIKPLGEPETGKRTYSLVGRKEKPESIICNFCKKEMEYTLNDGPLQYWRPPGRCKCEKATEYWEKYDKYQKQIEDECEKLEDIEKRKLKIDRLLATSNLGRRFQNRTFETFEINKSNKAIYEKCYNYARDFSQYKEQGAGLFFTGGVGTGKTHLAAAIANYLINDLVIPVKFGNVTSLLSEIRSTYGEYAKETEAEVIYTLSNVDLLIIDDLGKENRTEWSNSIIYTIINNRYENYKPIIVTTNLAIKELENRVGEATVSRLIEMCEGIKMDGLDYRKARLI